jgi:ketosteroid isomerase-like protein
VSAGPVAVAQAWFAAFARRDAEAMVALTAPDAEFARRLRPERGHDAVRAFVERQGYGVGMHPVARRVFQRGETVVIESRLQMRYVDGGELAGEDEGAALFVVRDGLVARFAPHARLADALREAGLGETDVVAGAGEGPPGS